MQHRSRSRVLVSGPLAMDADGFGLALARRGYRPSSIEGQLRLMAQLSCWLRTRGLAAGELTVDVAECFVGERRRAGRREWVTVTPGLSPLLEHLRRVGVVPPAAPLPPEGPGEVLLAGYDDYLTGERGLTRTAARNYMRVARRFVAARCALSDPGLTGVTAGQVSDFVLVECRKCRSSGAVKDVVVGMRALLRYLFVAGVTDAALDGAVPAAAHRPAGFAAAAVDPCGAALLLRRCDRRTAAGRRDFAILTLMLRLGLRAGEVAALRCDDLDWRHGEILIRGKGNRQERLPLPADVGQAVAGWLRRGRPRCQCPGVFTTLRAPLGTLTAATVSSLVGRAARRAGLSGVSAHRLRYFAATELLRAGAEFGEVQQVLRHANIRHTAAYAKVDQVALTALARPWPAAGAR